ncbi:unnamed protein product [Rotaria sp. Silwood2]|nr:unnamed protein product [Rotaria sp. Silwood2]CAF4438840.1 unnamed protein product [Rotaria sp. Silwood2]
MGISHCLSHLLWSIFTQATGCRIFTNGADLVQTFELYSRNNALQSTTLFVTFNIHELCTKFSHDIMFKALEHLLLTYGTEETMDGLTIETILQLVRLVLGNQFFVYQNRLYQQTIGNGSGCPLTIPLTYIYLCYCQPAWMSVLMAQKQQNELFGRFQYDVFLTWNRSEDQLQFLFEKPITLEKHHRAIHIEPSIGTMFHFLDVVLGHHHGHLHTRIYHDPVMDQYELPNKFEDETCLSSRLLQMILMYAVRCCSNEESFHFERRYIKLVYLLYDFSVHFIDDSIQQFYKQFHASEVHYLIDRIPYETLRKRVIQRYEQLINRIPRHIMVEQIHHQAIDVVLPWMDNMYENEDDNDNNEKIINLSEYTMNERPLYRVTRKDYLNIIRQQLQANECILLTAYNTYAYYACALTEMKLKIHEHMTRTGAYHLMMEFHSTHSYVMEEVVKKMDYRIMKKLDSFLHNKLISYWQWLQMSINQLNSRLNFLYYLPDTRRVNVPFHPMFYCRHRLTMNMSHFLSRLLQPIHNLVTFSTTYHRATDVIDTLEEYARKGHLRSNTVFATLYIHDLSTIIPHQQIMDTLKCFLYDYLLDQQIEGITIPTILDLVRLFLDNQYILYENKLYRQIRGSGFNSPLTTILANICLYYWQQDLVHLLNEKQEIFGRCFDEIFFTWNESEDRLRDILHTIHRQQPNIQISLSISQNINYLDINISHDHNGDLKTQVNHNRNTEPYSLPYVVGHPRNSYHTLFRATLLRATRCYAQVFDFVNELQDIQLSFQYNRFSNDFISDQIQLFLEEFGVPQMNVYCGEIFSNQSLYDHLRYNVFNYHQRRKQWKLKRYQQIF